MSVEKSNPLATIRGARVSKGWGAILPELHLSHQLEIQNRIQKKNKLWYLSDPQTPIDDPSLWSITPIECTAAEYMRLSSALKSSLFGSRDYVLRKVSGPSSTAMAPVANTGAPSVEDGLEWSTSE